MPLSFSLRKQAIVLCISIGICFAMVYQAGRLYLAWKWGDSSQLQSQMRGAELVPGNAEVWDRLGRAVESNFDQFDPRQPLAYFKKSVAVDPHSAEFWLDLAAAYELNGEEAQAGAAYKKAQQVYPISANVAWQYGNFLLRNNEMSDGLSEIRSAVSTDPALMPLALSAVWRFEQNVQFIKTSLPRNAAAYFSAIDYFSGEHQSSAALELWSDLLTILNGDRIELRSIFPLEDELIAEQRAKDAIRVWREGLAAARWPQMPAAGDSLVWNGGFELDSANGGLDWRIPQAPGAYISLDQTEKHSGARSLRVDFTGGMNLDFSAVSQFVPVEPNQLYTLTGYMKTRDISTESGLRLEAKDVVTGKAAETEQLTGAHDWTALSCTFQTGPATQFVEIRLRRFPSRLFNNQLSGTVWLDDVSVIPVNASARSNKEEP